MSAELGGERDLHPGLHSNSPARFLRLVINLLHLDRLSLFPQNKDVYEPFCKVPVITSSKEEQKLIATSNKVSASLWGTTLPPKASNVHGHKLHAFSGGIHIMSQYLLGTSALPVGARGKMIHKHRTASLTHLSLSLSSCSQQSSCCTTEATTSTPTPGKNKTKATCSSISGSALLRRRWKCCFLASNWLLASSESHPVLPVS